MATKADFTEDEWKTLQKGVTGAGMLVSLADRDFTDTFGEASTMAKHLAAQQKAGSALVQELGKTRGTGFGMTDSLEKVEAETLEALRSASAILATKAPDELSAYRDLVVGMANAVAEAKGGVKENETAAIQKITAALG
jgi:tellurite resistance protein